MMWRLFSRAWQALLTLFVILCLSFFLQRAAPGGPFDLEREMPAASRRALEQEWQLDRSLPVQLGSYLQGLAQFPPDLKHSMSRPDFSVMELLWPRLMVSLSLAGVVLIFSLLLGIFFGTWAAMNRHRWSDHLVMVLALIGLSLPNFVVGPLLKWVFALKLGVLPESRWVGPASMVLPALSMSALYIAIIARMVRSGLVEAANNDFMRAAKSRGLGPWRLMLIHAMPQALLPVVSWLGPAAAGLAVGSVVIERVFAIPGMGNTLVDAAFNRDYTMVMGAVIVYSALLIAMNFLADLLLMVVDPSLRQDL